MSTDNWGFYASWKKKAHKWEVGFGLEESNRSGNELETIFLSFFFFFPFFVIFLKFFLQNDIKSDLCCREQKNNKKEDGGLE